MNFSEKLKYLRGRTGCTQTEIAVAVGLTPQYYYLLEGGKQTPGDKAISLISKYYGVSPEYLTNPAVTEERPVEKPVEQKTESPPADIYHYRMSDGSLCTAKKCAWRRRIDSDTYFCPAGCMKAFKKG